MRSKYLVGSDTLLYSACKNNLTDAVKYLIDTEKYDNNTLESALLISNVANTLLILQALDYKRQDVDLPLYLTFFLPNRGPAVIVDAKK